MGLGEEDILITAYQGCTVSPGPIPVDADLDLLAELVLSGFSNAKLLFHLPSFNSVLLGSSRYKQPTPKGWGLGSISLEASIYIYFLEFFRMGALTLLPHYIVFPCKILSVFCLKRFVLETFHNKMKQNH